MNPTLEGCREEPGRNFVVALFGNPIGGDPQPVLQHRRRNRLVVVVDDAEVLRLVQLSGLRVDRLQDLGVLVVDHCLGGVDLVVEQGVHGEVLRHQLAIGDLELLDGGEHLELVAESPVAHSLSRPVFRGLDARVGPGDLEGAGALEDLGDVDDVCAAFTGDEGLGDPGDAELGATGGQDLLWDDLHRPLEDLDIQALRLVEAVVEGDVIAGELRLGEPLQLEPDRIGFGAFLGRNGRPLPLAACLAAITTAARMIARADSHRTWRRHLLVFIEVPPSLMPAHVIRPGRCPRCANRLRYSLVRNETCQGISHRSAARISR